MSSSLTRRKITNTVMLTLCGLSIVLALIPLAFIMFYTMTKGLSAINIDFFTQLPKPVGVPGSGMANAIVGTLILIGLASAVGVPIGILAGVFLSEYSRHPLVPVTRFLTEVLSGLPSIIIGIFAYAILVIPMGYSAYAGGVALGIIMIPTITKTTEELLKLVPVTFREAALALGAAKWTVSLNIVLRTAAKGIITGILLSVARIAGETAPLIFTSLNNRYWHQGLDKPIASLPVQLYNYALSPFEEWQAQAWAAAMVLIVLVFVLSVVIRSVTGGKYSVHQ